ncbi:MAG: bifunctional phosphoglucose/phosphomannose isomerase [Cyanobacteria bacterium REEB65]|nr:bifunctional phosphoglucose/phosphomannose isomerase [Cyanobacteria bacterium REEB65]
MTPSILDDPARREALDPQGMLACVQRMGSVAGPAFQRGLTWRPPLERPEHILVCAMGGSAISGDLARAVLQPHWDVPITVLRQPAVPAWVDARTLCLFISYSGNTQETLAAFSAAQRRGAAMAAIASGGQLEALCSRAGVSVLGVEAGWQPRAALGHLYFTLLGMLGSLGAPVDPQRAIARLQELCAAYGPQDGENPAKRLAQRLFESSGMPLIAGVSPATDAVAMRWKCQLNENAKTTVLVGAFPELTHNEIVNLIESREPRTVVVLRDPADSSLVTAQIREAAALLEQAGIGEVLQIEAEGNDPLERQLGLVCLGDFVSVYLAYLKGIDPTPVAPIVALKQGLARSQGPA